METALSNKERFYINSQSWIARDVFMRYISFWKKNHFQSVNFTSILFLFKLGKLGNWEDF